MIHAKFNTLQVPITLITFPWLLCLYIGAIDWEVADILVCGFISINSTFTAPSFGCNSCEYS